MVPGTLRYSKVPGTLVNWKMFDIILQMARPDRNFIDNGIYHILNRANNKDIIFQKELDYYAFEKLLEEGKTKYPIRILSYTIMPNHWHLVLSPYKSEDLPRYMRWITLTHVQRWKKHHEKIGFGHLYQGRFKSYLIDKDEQFLQVCRYIERNPLKAGLVKKAGEWRWSSFWIRKYDRYKMNQLLSKWPMEIPIDYENWVNQVVENEKNSFDFPD